jgi:hypothetical protein
LGGGPLPSLRVVCPGRLRRHGAKGDFRDGNLVSSNRTAEQLHQPDPSRRRHNHNSKTSFVSNLQDQQNTGPKDQLVDDSKEAAIAELGGALIALGMEGKNFDEFTLSIVEVPLGSVGRGMFAKAPDLRQRKLVVPIDDGRDRLVHLAFGDVPLVDEGHLEPVETTDGIIAKLTSSS